LRLWRRAPSLNFSLPIELLAFRATASLAGEEPIYFPNMILRATEKENSAWA